MSSTIRYIALHAARLTRLTALLALVGAAIAGYYAMRFFKKGAPPTPQMAIDEGKRIQQTVNEARSAEVQR